MKLIKDDFILELFKVHTDDNAAEYPFRRQIQARKERIGHSAQHFGLNPPIGISDHIANILPLYILREKVILELKRLKGHFQFK